MEEYNKICLVCKKEYKAKRKHSKTCSDICRTRNSYNNKAILMVSGEIIEAAKPIIIAQAIKVYEEEHEYACSCCRKNFKISLLTRHNFKQKIKGYFVVDLCKKCIDFPNIGDRIAQEMFMSQQNYLAAQKKFEVHRANFEHLKIKP